MFQKNLTNVLRNGNCLVNVMKSESVYSNQGIYVLIENKKNMIEDMCRSYFVFLQKEEEKRNSLLENCSKLIDWANAQTHKIKDSVFGKQAQYYVNTGIDMPNVTIDEACSKLEADINCIVASRIPPWLSSVCYIISHQWRKVVYEEIIKNYVFIIKYAEKESNCARSEFEINIEKKKLLVKNEIATQINVLFKDIRQQVFDDNNIFTKND